VSNCNPAERAQTLAITNNRVLIASTLVASVDRSKNFHRSRLAGNQGVLEGPGPGPDVAVALADPGDQRPHSRRSGSLRRTHPDYAEVVAARPLVPADPGLPQPDRRRHPRQRLSRLRWGHTACMQSPVILRYVAQVAVRKKGRYLDQAQRNPACLAQYARHTAAGVAWRIPWKEGSQQRLGRE
jgi:hypothetical protein